MGDLYFMALAFGVLFGVPLAALGGALGQGKIGAAAMEAMARQPELAGNIQMAMIIALAFVESLSIYALLIFFIVMGKLPAADVMLQAVQTKLGGG